MAAELRVLVNAGTIRVIDVLILTKDADGTVEANELSDIQAIIASIEADRIGCDGARRLTCRSDQHASEELA